MLAPETNAIVERFDVTVATLARRVSTVNHRHYDK